MFFFTLLWKSLWIRRRSLSALFFSLVIYASLVASLLSVYFDITSKVGHEFRNYGANLLITLKPNPELKFDFPAAWVEQIFAEIPDKAYFGHTPILYGMVRSDLEDVLIAGVQFSGLHSLAKFWQIEGRWVSMDYDDHNVMIGSKLAAHLHLNLEDELTLKNGFDNTYQKFKIRGIFNSGEHDDNLVFLSLETAQKLLGKAGLIQLAKFGVDVKSLDFPDFIKKLSDKYPQLSVQPMTKLSFEQGQLLEKIKGMMGLIIGIIGLVSFLSVCMSMIALTLQRRQEMALLKSLGGEKRIVIALFTSEMFALTCVAVTIGLVAAIGISQLIGHIVFSSSIGFRWQVVPLTLGICLAMVLSGVVISVRGVIQLKPADVLK
jgi:putative ABC transport system permease protein